MSSNDTVMAQLQRQQTMTPSLLLETLNKLDQSEQYYTNNVHDIRNFWMDLKRPKKTEKKGGFFGFGGETVAVVDPDPLPFELQDLINAGCEIFLESLQKSQPICEKARNALITDEQLTLYCQAQSQVSPQYPINLHKAFWECFTKFPTDKEFIKHGILLSTTLINSLKVFNHTVFSGMVECCISLGANDETLHLSKALIEGCLVPYIVQYNQHLKLIIRQFVQDARNGNNILEVLVLFQPQYRTDILNEISTQIASATDATDSAIISYWKKLSLDLLKDGLDDVDSFCANVDILEKNPQARKLWYELMRDVCVPLLEKKCEFAYATDRYRGHRRLKFEAALKQYRSDALEHYRAQDAATLVLPMRAPRWEVMKYDAEDIHWLFQDINLRFTSLLKGNRSEKWRQLLNEIAELSTSFKEAVYDNLLAFDTQYAGEQFSTWQCLGTPEEKNAYFENELLPHFKRTHHQLTVKFKITCLAMMVQANDFVALDHMIPIFCAENDMTIPYDERFAVWKSLPERQERPELPELPGCKKETKDLLLKKDDVCTLIKDILQTENPDWDGIRALLKVHPPAMISVGDDRQLSMPQLLHFSRALVVENKFPDNAEFLNERVVRLLLLQNIEPVDDAARANHNLALGQYNDLKSAYAAATRTRSRNTRPLACFILKNPTVTQQWLDASVALGAQNPFPNIEKVLPWMQAAMKADANDVPIVNLAMLKKLSEDKHYLSYAKDFYKKLSPSMKALLVKDEAPVDERYIRALRILEDYADPVKNFCRLHWNRRFAKMLKAFLIEERNTAGPKTEAGLKTRLAQWKDEQGLLDFRRKGKDELGSFGRRDDYLKLECEGVVFNG